jgi:hypothetical protein
MKTESGCAEGMYHAPERPSQQSLRTVGLPTIEAGTPTLKAIPLETAFRSACSGVRRVPRVSTCWWAALS